MKDGIYPDLSFEDYLGDNAASRSGLMKLLPPWTPADYQWAVDHPKEEKDPMRFGTVIHTAILEPEEFHNRHTHFSMKPNRALVDMEKARDRGCLTKHETADEEAAALSEGKTIIDEDKFNTALHYGETVRGDPACALLLGDGQPEVSIFYTDEETGVQAKTRQDWGLSTHGLVVDVKSTASTSERFLTRHMADLGYDVQAAMIREACIANEIPWTGHVIVWCRTDDALRPEVLVQRVSPMWLQRGEMLMRRAYGVLADCLESGEWPGPTNLIGDTPEPQWLERWIEEYQSELDYPEQYEL